ncbi:hypothetical protein PVT68_10065 [Microbulbifer bruguierae]|uniref:Extracellular endo-alpha-(1->5)-L-arabinanase C-terminal domain-containing protein n=1 Tax=Microbulbifer bruguierae TaxID=3029061 RepID=A0ABY8NBF1_9GAMM|nr:hypothetical protein [Microbulbifer bruguierae]WGL15122.1 hypothetical protein PVT68_10065 [Microbulbifer bruguierae]
MKNIVLFVFVFFLSSIVTAQSLVGVWELDSGEYIDGDGQLVDYSGLGFKSLKIISNSHFSFTSMKGDKFWASGSGTYKVKDGKYTEKLKFNSFGEESGSEFVFDVKIENQYWHNSRWKDGVRVEYEVWRRVE